MDDSSPLEASFQQAAARVRQLDHGLDSAVMLRLYALYKQSTLGPCTGSRPGLFQFTARTKWDAWNSLGSMTSRQAMADYVQLVTTLGVDTDADADVGNISMMGVAVSCPARTEPRLADADKTVFDWVKEGNLERTRSALTGPGVVDEADGEGMHLVHWAADRGHVDMLRLLLELGARVDACDAGGQTPLHYAYACGHHQAVTLLLDAGADAELRDHDGNLPRELSES